MSAKTLLIVTALIEAGAAVVLLIVPSFAAELLLGKGLTSPESLAVARVTGCALISISVACWLARNAERRAQSAQIAGISLYNLAVPVVLIRGWFASGFEGLGLWPATILHLALAVWCIKNLRANR